MQNEGELVANEHVALSVDTSCKESAEEFVRLAKEIGAHFIKFGLELSSATSWRYCSELANEYDLGWIADTKLNDIPSTVKKSVSNICNVARPPFAITMHTTAGMETMRIAQKSAENVKILGVTVLTAISNVESMRLFRVPVKQKVMELALDAVDAGISGVVSSPLEVNMIKSNPETKQLFVMTPGIRSETTKSDDQFRIATPAYAIQNGADLIVVGRQITQSTNPSLAFRELITEIEEVL